MAKCKGCGIELLDGTVFCPYCGAQVQNVEGQNVEEQNFQEQNVEFSNNVNEVVDAVEPVEKKESGVFKVFSILGMIFGIVVIVFTCLSFLSMSEALSALFLAAFALEFSLPGMIFSIIGKKGRSAHGKAVFGFVANLVCLILSVILLFVAAFIFVAQGGSPDDIYGGFYF